MKRFSVLTCGLAALVVASSAYAEDLSRLITVDNQTTSRTIVDVGASNLDNFPEQYYLDNKDLTPGNARVVDIDDGMGYCRFNIIIYYRDGSTQGARDVNVCQQPIIQITDDDIIVDIPPSN